MGGPQTVTAFFNAILDMLELQLFGVTARIPSGASHSSCRFYFLPPFRHNSSIPSPIENPETAELRVVVMDEDFMKTDGGNSVWGHQNGLTWMR